MPLFLLTLGLLVVGLVARGRARPAGLFRCLLFTFLLFTAIRHLPLAALIVLPVVASSLSSAARRGGWRANLEPTGAHWGRPWIRLAAAGAVVAAIVSLSGAFTRSGARFVTLWPRFEVRPVRTMPEEAVRFLAQSRIEGSVFNAYRFGGFLMFRLYPEERTFMDGRNDLYEGFRDEVYNRILETRPGWRTVWEDAVWKYDIGCVLLDESDPLAEALRADPGWLAPFEGRSPVTDGQPGRDAVVLLLRDTPRNRERLAVMKRPPPPAGTGE